MTKKNQKTLATQKIELTRQNAISYYHDLLESIKNLADMQAAALKKADKIIINSTLDELTIAAGDIFLTLVGDTEAVNV